MNRRHHVGPAAGRSPDQLRELGRELYDKIESDRLDPGPPDPADPGEPCDDEGEHRGPVRPGPSRSGATRYVKCERHWDLYDQWAEKLHQEVNSRFPGYDIPGSPPPPWFREDDIGESWDEPS